MPTACPDSRIVLLIPTLHGGGAEAVMARMASWWAARGADVRLVTFFADARDHPLHPAVRRVLLDDIPVPEGASCPEWPQEAGAVARIRIALEEIVAERPEAILPVLAFLPRMGLRAILAARGLPCRIVAAERTFPPSLPLPEDVEDLRRRLYPEAAALAVQTERCANLWGRRIVPHGRCHVIPNFPLPAPAAAPPRDPEPGFLFVGRLSEEKRPDLLLRAFAVLRRATARMPRLTIVGDGPLEAEIRNLACEPDIAGGVAFTGRLADPRPLMAGAHALVLCSDFEGFPNVLLEAMACGCPVIATDCAAGPAEIVRHGTDGLLVPPGDADALAGAMRRLWEDADLRNSMAARAPDVLERFSQETIMRRWTDVLGLEPARGNHP